MSPPSTSCSTRLPGRTRCSDAPPKRPDMPTLLDVQRAMYRSLAERDNERAAGYIIADGLAAPDRLDIHRNTLVSSLTTALRLSYPAVHRLVGAAFFEG